jgi:hypothetical protein
MPHILSDDRAVLGVEYLSLADEIRAMEGLRGNEMEEAIAALREMRTLLQILIEPPAFSVGRDPSQLQGELLHSLIAKAYGVALPNGTWMAGTIIDLLESDEVLSTKQVHQAAACLELGEEVFFCLKNSAPEGELAQRVKKLHRALSSKHQCKATTTDKIIQIECDVCHLRSFGSVSIEIATRWARAQGWLITDDRDLCPDCRDDGGGPLLALVPDLDPTPPAPMTPLIQVSGEGTWQSFQDAAARAFAQGDTAVEFGEWCLSMLGRESALVLEQSLIGLSARVIDPKKVEPLFVMVALDHFRKALALAPDLDRELSIAEAASFGLASEGNASEPDQ